MSYTEPNWYCIDRYGLATLCAGEDDARENAADNDKIYPRQAPYRAVQLVEAAAAPVSAPPGWKLVPVAQEPDCWAVLTPNGSRLVSPGEAKGRVGAYPLYTHPAPAVQQPLTEAEIDALVRQHGTGGWQSVNDMAMFARAVEAAHGISAAPTAAKE